jgi:hypothetical protein
MFHVQCLKQAAVLCVNWLKTYCACSKCKVSNRVCVYWLETYCTCSMCKENNRVCAYWLETHRACSKCEASNRMRGGVLDTLRKGSRSRRVCVGEVGGAGACTCSMWYVFNVLLSMWRGRGSWSLYVFNEGGK